MLKFIKRVIMAVILVIIFAGAILTYKGHEMYKTALEKISVADKVSEIKAEENYTELNDLPEFYLFFLSFLRHLGIPPNLENN